jgi:hypothetical protein
LSRHEVNMAVNHKRAGIRMRKTETPGLKAVIVILFTNMFNIINFVYIHE